MSDDDAVRMTPEEIHLVRRIVRWRRDNDVRFIRWPKGGFGRFDEWYRWPAGGGKMVVAFDEAGLHVDRDYYGEDDTINLPRVTVAEVVDMLVALGVLPARFSSAYETGWRDGWRDGGVGHDEEL